MMIVEAGTARASAPSKRRWCGRHAWCNDLPGLEANVVHPRLRREWSWRHLHGVALRDHGARVSSR
eukprot:15143693-Heterocapsa_arctica.AAC.1